MRKISLYIVAEIEKFKNNIPQIITMTTTRKEGIEYIINRLILDHLSHYTAWCELQKKDSKNKESKYSYIRNICAEELVSKYICYKVSYNKNQLALVLRLYNNCIPIGCSFDKEIEYLNMSSLIKNLNKDKNVVD